MGEPTVNSSATLEPSGILEPSAALEPCAAPEPSAALLEPSAALEPQLKSENDVEPLPAPVHDAKPVVEDVQPMPTPEERQPTVVPVEHLMADAIFSKLVGPHTTTISPGVLADYLINRDDMTLATVQSILAALDTNGDGSIDRQEWRAGFAAGIVPSGSSRLAAVDRGAAAPTTE